GGRARGPREGRHRAARSARRPGAPGTLARAAARPLRGDQGVARRARGRAALALPRGPRGRLAPRARRVPLGPGGSRVAPAEVGRAQAWRALERSAAIGSIVAALSAG